MPVHDPTQIAPRRVVQRAEGPRAISRGPRQLTLRLQTHCCVAASDAMGPGCVKIRKLLARRPPDHRHRPRPGFSTDTRLINSRTVKVDV